MRLLELSVALAVVGCLDPSKAGNLVPRTVAEDRSLPRIDLPDTAFHGELLGDPTGPLLVLLHGGPGADHRYMLPVAEQLADDGYGVVVWDHRGAGLSTRHDPGDFHWEQPVEDLRLVIEHFSVDADQPVVFVGHSWGAMYATWFINEHGDYGGRVRGAVLSEPGAYTSEQLESYFGRLFGSMDFLGEQVNDTAWKDQLMTPGDHARADYLWAITAVALPAEHIDPDNPSPSWRGGAIANETLIGMAAEDGFDWSTDLDAFPTEVLFLRGELNEAMPLWHQQELAGAWPSARIVTIEGVGHDVVWERQDRFVTETRAYLSTLDLSWGTP